MDSATHKRGAPLSLERMGYFQNTCWKLTYRCGDFYQKGALILEEKGNKCENSNLPPNAKKTGAGLPSEGAGFSAVGISSEFPPKGWGWAQGPKPGVHSLRLRGDMMDETGWLGPSLQAALAVSRWPPHYSAP